MTTHVPIVFSGARTCEHPVERPAVAGGTTTWAPCGNSAPGYRADLHHLQRSVLTRCYCAEHGGAARAIAEIECDWLYVAPASVGDANAVLDAGCASLGTQDAYVVVRRDDQHRWLAYIGLGSMLEQVQVRAEPVTRHGRVYTRGSKLRGMMAGDTCAQAHAAAMRAWRAQRDARVEAITELRGGTLAWGAPVEPLDDPITIDATGANAWTLAEDQPRRGRDGLASLTGLRPSGESA